MTRACWFALVFAPALMAQQPSGIAPRLEGKQATAAPSPSLESAGTWSPAFSLGARPIEVARPSTVLRATVDPGSTPLIRIASGVAGTAIPSGSPGVLSSRFAIDGWACVAEPNGRELIAGWRSGGRTVSATWLHVRVAPGKESILASLPNGATVEPGELPAARPALAEAPADWGDFDDSIDSAMAGPDLVDGSIVTPDGRTWIPVKVVVEGYLPRADVAVAR